MIIAKCSAIRKIQGKEIGGDEEDRTPGLGIANAALSQLSYIPGKAYYHQKPLSGQSDQARLFGTADRLEPRMGREFL